MERRWDIRRLGRNALIVLIMTGLIAYVVYHCLQYFKNPVQTTVAVRQSERQTQTLTAYLFRDEEVLTSSRPGALQTLLLLPELPGKIIMPGLIFQKGQFPEQIFNIMAM